MAAILHWLDDPDRQHKPGHEHHNPIRMTAETMAKLIELRNRLSGKRMSVFEASQLAAENDY